jgi:hypothetical protein
MGDESRDQDAAGSRKKQDRRIPEHLPSEGEEMIVGRGIVFFVVFLATVVCYAKRQPTPEEIAQERAVQAAMAEIDGAAVKEEAQGLKLSSAALFKNLHGAKL